MNINIYIFLIIQLLNIGIIKAFTLSILSFFYNGNDNNFREIVNRYNQYNADRNIDIDIKVVPLNENNQTMTIEEYTNTVASLCSKKSTKYDIYIYYDYDIKTITSHLVDFRNYVDDDYINKFPPELIANTKTPDGKIVGIPFSLTFTAFYSNQMLLSKYGMKAPKTWQEVLDIGKHILTEERKNNNTLLIGYNGLLSNDENGDLALQSFFHSYRESNYHPRISYDSQNAKDALKMLKTLKDEISSDEIFLSDLGFTFEKLFSYQAIFIELFYMGPIPGYTATALPGKNDKVSGTAGSASNLLINKYISDEKKEAAVDFIKFITSDEIQKEFFLSGELFSPINELYDEESCKKIDCEVAIGSRPYSFSLDEPDFLDKKFYSNKIKEYAFSYIYGDTDLEEAVKKMVDLKKIYKVSLGTSDSNMGLIIFITTIAILCLMSLVLMIHMVITKCKNNSRFFTNDLWILSLLGTAIMICANFTIFGNVTSSICYLRMIIFNIGFYLNVAPILAQLIANFPVNTKYTVWFYPHKNKYTFISIVMMAELFLLGLSMVKSYTISNVIIVGGENYQICEMNHTWGKTITNAIEIIQIVIQLVLLFFQFIEWNLIETTFEVRILFSLSVLDILCFFIYQVVKRIQFNNYVYTNLVLFIMFTIISVTNFVFVYLLKIKVLIKGKANSMDSIIDEIRKPSGKNSTTTNSSNIIKSSAYKYSTNTNSTLSEPKSQSSNNNENTNQSNLFNKLMMYHFTQAKEANV